MWSVAFRSSSNPHLQRVFYFQSIAVIPQTQPWHLKCINWAMTFSSNWSRAIAIIDPGLMVTMGVIYVDCPTRAQEALHVRSAGYPDLDPGNAFGASHSHRHFSEYKHPRGEHHLEFHRARSGGDGESNHRSSRAQLD